MTTIQLLLAMTKSPALANVVANQREAREDAVTLIEQGRVKATIKDGEVELHDPAAAVDAVPAREAIKLLRAERN